MLAGIRDERIALLETGQPSGQEIGKRHSGKLAIERDLGIPVYARVSVECVVDKVASDSDLVRPAYQAEVIGKLVGSCVVPSGVYECGGDIEVVRHSNVAVLRNGLVNTLDSQLRQIEKLGRIF